MEENFISWLASTKKHQCTRELLASDPEREPGSRNAHSDLIVSLTRNFGSARDWWPWTYHVPAAVLCA